jgi:putative FmdB family regulatory protein
MPIYEYRCASCGFENEYLQKVSDPLLTDCPECGKSTFSKLVSAAGFQLKGNGWYVTDFRNNGSKPAAGKDKAEGGGDKPIADKAEPSEPKKEAKSEAECGTGACPACT